jgi:hypothetical protein
MPSTTGCTLRGNDTGEHVMMPVEFDVAGRIVFITGAGRGVGKGIAQVLAEAGPTSRSMP